MVEVREIDPVTGPVADVLAVHAIERACASELHPGEPGRSVEEAVAYLTNPPPGQVRRHWLAESAGEVVGAASLTAWGPSFVNAHVLVAPEARRRGAGSALLECVRAAARDANIRSFFGHYANDAGAAFAARVGAVDDQRDVRSVLDLRSALLPEPRVPTGWVLRSWIDRAPDELAASFVRARDAMNDAPTPGGQVMPDGTVEELRAMEETCVRRGREMRVTVAVDERGEVGAFTDVRVTAGSSAAGTDDTAAAPWARGRGLVVAVKVESLCRLRAEHPQVEVVSTMNAEQNTRMREINHRIGFVPTVTLTTTVITL
jgi:mycothiol synthase